MVFNVDELEAIQAYLQELVDKYSPEKIDLVCLGTTRIVGDSVGPLIGTSINPKKKLNIIGTVSKPIYRKNYHKRIQDKRNDALCIAIDACISDEYKIGTIIIEEVPLKPGAGVVDTPTEVGDISIKCIVGSNLDQVINADYIKIYEIAYNISTIINNIF
jgi:putative sporulation protein YyaC